MANQWFRMYGEFEDDPKVRMLPDVMQLRLVWLMCEHCKDVTLSERHRAFQWRCTEREMAETKAEFIAAGFIDEEWNLLNWSKRQYISDNSTERTRRYRERKRTSLERHSDASVTPPDTDTEQKQIRTEVSDANASSPRRDADGDGADEFIYAAYPRKEGHRAAIKAIGSAVDRLRRGEAPFPAMEPREARVFLFRKVQGYARSPAGQNPDRTKIPHPATWMNQGRYLDDESCWQQVAIEFRKGESSNGTIADKKLNSVVASTNAAIARLRGMDRDADGGNGGAAGRDAGWPGCAAGAHGKRTLGPAAGELEIRH